MDAVEYLRVKTRMCDSLKECGDCPLDKINNTDNINCFDRHYEEEAVAIVEKWTAEHPVKTRQSEFLKMFPNAKVEEGVLIFCPTGFGETLICEAFGDIDGCNNCKRKYWLTEEQNEKHR